MITKISSTKLSLVCLIFTLTACDSSKEEANTSTEQQANAPAQQIAEVTPEPVVAPTIETEE